MKAGIGMGELETRDETAVRVLGDGRQQREPGQERREFGAGHGFQALKRSITQCGVQLTPGGERGEWAWLLGQLDADILQREVFCDL